jgi:protein involved in polysaccharide export with SLBB domain
LQNGDRLRVLIVTMIGKSDMRVCIVDESGHIRLPMIGNIPVAGSTPAEIDAAALKLYQDAALHIESVSTTLEDRRETHNEMPGHVPWKAALRTALQVRSGTTFCRRKNA